MIPELETDRLLLRGLRVEDLDSYAAMYGDPEVMRFLQGGSPLDRYAAWRSMATHLGHWSLRGYGQWALIERVTGEFVGRAGLWQPDGWPGLEVGWVLARPHWGHGYAGEAARAAIAYAFDRLDATHLISLINPDNGPSIRLAKRLGETYERTIDLLGVRAHIYGLHRP